jgi:hypothetical protein
MIAALSYLLIHLAILIVQIQLENQGITSKFVKQRAMLRASLALIWTTSAWILGKCEVISHLTEHMGLPLISPLIFWIPNPLAISLYFNSLKAILPSQKDCITTCRQLDGKRVIGLNDIILDAPCRDKIPVWSRPTRPAPPHHTLASVAASLFSFNHLILGGDHLDT